MAMDDDDDDKDDDDDFTCICLLPFLSGNLALVFNAEPIIVSLQLIIKAGRSIIVERAYFIMQFGS